MAAPHSGDDRVPWTNGMSELGNMHEFGSGLRQGEGDSDDALEKVGCMPSMASVGSVTMGTLVISELVGMSESVLNPDRRAPSGGSAS